MSWNCSQALAAEFSARGFLGTEQCVRLNSIRTAGKSSFVARKKATWNPFPSGTTSELSMVDHGVEQWILSLAGSHASHGASQENRKEKQTRETCGPTLSESFARWNHDLRSWRTFQGSLVNPTSGNKSSQALRKRGSMCDGKLFLLPMLELLTFAKGSGYMPTPTVNDSRGGRNKTSRRSIESNHHDGTTLTDFVTIFPTPSASAYGTNQGGSAGRVGKVRPSLETMAKQVLWPTIRASDGSHSGPNQRDSKGRPAVGGKLNPTWVAWLMGWPIGWTALEPLAMDRFRQWLQKHGNF